MAFRMAAASPAALQGILNLLAISNIVNGSLDEFWFSITT